MIDRYVLNVYLKTIIIAVIALFGNLETIILPFTLPFALGPSLVGVGLYYLGYLCKKFSTEKVFCHLMNLSWMPNILLGIITAILIRINGYINMRTGSYAIIPLFWVNAMLSIIVGINLARLVYPYIQNNHIGNWLTSIGRNSIVYVCLNQIVIRIVNNIVNVAKFPIMFSKTVILIITLLVLYIVSNIIVNTKLKILIGK